MTLYPIFDIKDIPVLKDNTNKFNIKDNNIHGKDTAITGVWVLPDHLLALDMGDTTHCLNAIDIYPDHVARSVHSVGGMYAPEQHIYMSATTIYPTARITFDTFDEFISYVQEHYDKYTMITG